ncbi:MAG: di-heme oxidoredictase family protein [Planctomycetota bacterium]
MRVGDATGAPVPELGAVLRSRVTDGEPESAARLSGWTAVGDLRAPAYAFTGEAPAHYSVRIAPQLVGMGLLEAIPEADVQALADPDDANGDGISGRMRIVEDVETGERRLGRFGWKAAEPRVAHQVAAALDMDMGVRTSLRPGDDVGPDVDDVELDDAHLRDLTAYVSLLGVSARRGLASVDALRGEALFAEIGCAACHTPTFRTSSFHPHAELRDQTTHPYTDLLLHDMGPRLASTLIEGGASAAEWRTAPLWNIGLTARVSGAEAYLHDGRARSLEEAILWHGGEGEAARGAYLALPDDRRGELIAFLRSL